MPKLQPLLTALLAIIAAVLSTAADVRAQPSWTQVGVLDCRLAPTVGLLIASRQEMSCRFTHSRPLPPENYVGAMTTIGLDVGVIAGGALAWAVFSPTQGSPFGGLAGSYVGASGEVSAGIGVGANVLIGGSARSVALQPFSVEGTAGLSFQLGLSDLELRPAP
jgi:uncharacterized protein DUF992